MYYVHTLGNVLRRTDGRTDDGARIWTTIDDGSDRDMYGHKHTRARGRGSRGTNGKWRVTGEDVPTKDAASHDANELTRGETIRGFEEDASE